MEEDAVLIKKIEIPEIIYPKEITEELKKLDSFLVKGIRKYGNSLASFGTIPMDELPPALEWRVAFFLWIAETNEIISSLNLILSDFYNLADKPSRFSGNLRDRAYLLLRVFFYEFSRIQDVFSRFIKELMRLGMINRDTVKFLREQFNEIFKDGIKLRNKIVHERMSWPGKENLDLIIVSTINQLGQIAVEKETLKERTINQVLIKFYNKLAPQLLVEGMHMANMLQHLVNKFSQIVQKKETQELKHSQGQEDLM